MSRGGPPGSSACRQLLRPEQEQSHDALPDMACRDWSAQVCLHQLHGGRTHQVRPGLGLRPAEEEDKKDVRVIAGRHRSSNLVQCVGTHNGQVIVRIVGLLSFLRPRLLVPWS